MRSGKRRKEIRQLARQARERSQQPEPEILNGIPVEPSPDEKSNAGKSTIVEAKAVPDPMLEPFPDSRKRSTRISPQDDTVEAAAIREPIADSKGETEGALDADLKEPDAPDKVGFTCACGAKLVATKKAYDKRMRCASCKTLMLVSLVWDPKKQAYEIVPFRVENLPDVGA